MPYGIEKRALAQRRKAREVRRKKKIFFAPLAPWRDNYKESSDE